MTDTTKLEDVSLILWDIPQIDPGGIKILTYKVKLNPSIPLGTTIEGPACTGKDMLGIVWDCIKSVIQGIPSCAPCLEVCLLCKPPVCPAGGEVCLVCLGGCLTFCAGTGSRR